MAALIEFYFPDEIISRFGGEEFCIYLPNTPLDEACERLEAFRKVVEAEVIQLPSTDIKVTCSIGVCGTQTQRIDKLLSLADKQLYAAKNSGRNRVMCEEPDAPNSSRRHCSSYSTASFCACFVCGSALKNRH